MFNDNLTLIGYIRMLSTIIGYIRMLSTIIGFAFTLSPVATEAPEDNIGHEIGKSVSSIHIGSNTGKNRIDAITETSSIVGNRAKVRV